MSAEDYFLQVSEDVFSALMRGLGAKEICATSTHLRYEARDWFVEVLVLLNDGPRYCPRVEMGPLPELGVLPRETRVDIMHAVPAHSPQRDYNLAWRYEDRESMQNTFIRVRDQIFVPYAIPVLQDRELLVNLLQCRLREIEGQWKSETISHNDSIYRTKAQSALSAKDYHEYLVNMRHIPAERQTNSEAARVKYAKQKI